MPHLDDAGENDDVVALLRQQHNHIRDLFAEVEKPPPTTGRSHSAGSSACWPSTRPLRRKWSTPQPAVSCRTVSRWSTIVTRRRGLRRRS
jgi:hypothetical protein